MKKFFLGSIVIASLVLTGCQDTSTKPERGKDYEIEGVTPVMEKVEDTQEKKGGVTVYQINDDGTSQEIMKIGGDKIATQENPTKSDVVSADLKLKGIAITKDGFAPAEITMKVGEKVIFRNMDEKEHWPASDPHPVHTIEPGLDSKKPLAQGESFEYIFTKAGTYSFHDHLMPSRKGVITVTE